MDREVARVRPDAEGHCEPRGGQLDFGDKVYSSVARCLDSGSDLHFTIRNSELYFSFTTAINGASPHLFIGWPLLLFGELSGERQEEYLQVIAHGAESASAAAVVIVRDPPGYFEDRVVVSNGDIIVDPQLYDGRAVDVREVWCGGHVDAGETVRVTGKGWIRGFKRYGLVDPR